VKGTNDMFLKLRFEIWVEDNSPDQTDSDEPDPWGSVLHLIEAELQQWNGLLATSTCTRKADTLAEIKEEFVRRFFLAKLAPITTSTQ